MASWREIERIRKDPTAAARIATALLKLWRAEFTDWELDFLEGISSRSEERELTTLQSEKLLQIRDEATFVTECGGFSVELLLRACHENRFDLSESDEEWITKLREKSKSLIRRKYVGRLMRCAFELNVIEEEVAA